jgi:SAM-dependent methyltransferase
MTDTATIAAYNNNAEKFANLPPDEVAHSTLLRFIARLKRNDFVLDLGCGPAEASATMRAHGLRVDPIDASPEMVLLANRKYDIGARLADFGDVSGHNEYNGIWANFSLLHAPPEDFPEHLSRLNQALVANGLFHIGMKLGTGVGRDKLGRYYAYYSQEELTAHLAGAGFGGFKVTLGEGAGLSGTVAPWIVICCRSLPDTV